MSYTPQDVHKKLLGQKGEKLVERYLKKQGLKILRRNYRTPFGEADIIAKEKDEIVFVEVKARTSESYGAPREAVDREKRRRYYQIAKFFWLEMGEEPNARFDVAEVDGEGNINYFKNAF